MVKKITSFLAIFMILAICMSVSVFAERAEVKGISGQKDDGDELSHDDGLFENIIDGNPETRWGSVNASDNGDHVAIIVELTKEEWIESIDIAFYRGHERIHRIDVEVSYDGGNTWEAVALTTNQTVADASLLTEIQVGNNDHGSYLNTFPLVTTTQGQYWKVKVYPREDAPDGVPNGERNNTLSIWELYFNLGAAPAVEVEEVIEAAAETAADATPAATETAPVTQTKTTAPQTADTSIVLLALVAISSLSAIVVLKKRKNN